MKENQQKLIESNYAENDTTVKTEEKTLILLESKTEKNIDQTISTAPLAAFEGVEDGRYFVRSRGVAASGLEGFSRPYTFRRKRVGSEAGAEPSPFADSFKFGWRADGSGDSFHGFQLWNGANPGSLLVDEVAIKKSAILIGDLPPGTYFWRVATMQIDEGEVIKVWTPAQQFSVGE